MLFNRVQHRGGQTNATFRTTRYNIYSKIFYINSSSPPLHDTFTSDSSPETILKDCKTNKRAQVKNSFKSTARSEDSKNTNDEVCKENFPGLVNKGKRQENCFY